MIFINAETHEYLLKRFINESSFQDAVEWATKLINTGIETPTLKALAELKEPLSNSTTTEYVENAFKELGWDIPEKETFLRYYLYIVAHRIFMGQTEPIKALNRINQVIQILGYPKDLQRWIDIIQKINPDTYDKIDGIHLKNTIIREATNYISSKSLATKRFGPNTDTKYMDKSELLRAGWKYLIASFNCLVIFIIIAISIGNSSKPLPLTLVLYIIVMIGFIITFPGGIYLLIRGLFRKKDYIIPAYKPKIIESIFTKNDNSETDEM